MQATVMTETSENNCKTDCKSCKILFCYIICQCMSEIVNSGLHFVTGAEKVWVKDLSPITGFSTD